MRFPGPIQARAGAAAAAVLVALACSDGDAPPLSAEAERGRAVYLNYCVACHHADPGQDGAIGPSLANSTAELIEAKTLRGEYPPGYVPKRPSAAMPRYEAVAGSIRELTTYVLEATKDR